MSAGSGAFGVKPGYNQSGGGYYIAFSSITSTSILQISTVGSGSGGAYSNPNVVAYAIQPSTGMSSLVTGAGVIAAGRVLRDMGKTVVSSGRAFRKFQAAVPTVTSTGGVSGNVPNTSTGAGDVGYLTFYLEVNSFGAATTGAGTSTGFGAPAPIARTFF